MTDSLIGLLQRASSAIYGTYHNGDHAADCEACQTYNDIEKYLDSLGDASARKDEECTGTPGSATSASVATTSPVASSEISVMDSDTIVQAIAALEYARNNKPASHFEWGMYDKAAIGLSRYLLNAPKPVSVDDVALWKSYRVKTDSAISHYEFRTIVRLSFQAAGVAYVD